MEGTAPTGGWIRRRSRTATERRRAEKRHNELSLNDNVCFSGQHRKLRGAFVTKIEDVSREFDEHFVCSDRG